MSVVKRAPARRSREGGNSCDTAGQGGVNQREYQDRRAGRYALREGARALTTLKNLRLCGYAMTSVAECVDVRLDAQGRAFVTGVQTCSSVHACPVCSAAIREKRARQVEGVSTRVLRDGGSVVFVTLTASHSRSDRLEVLLPQLAGAWHDLTSNRRWRSAPGLRGFVKTTEITDGFPNGWHPHLHALVFFDQVLDAAQLADFAAYVTESWSRSMEHVGRDVNEHGVRVQRIRLVAGRADVGEYLAKVQDGYGMTRSVGREMTRTDLKKGRRYNRFSPFELLDMATHGDVRARARWLEYEQATKGRRCLEWARSDWLKLLRDLVGDGDQEDNAEATGPGHSVAELTRDEWLLIARYKRQAQLLTAAERQGLAGVLELLRALRARDQYELARAARRRPRSRAVSGRPAVHLADH